MSSWRSQPGWVGQLIARMEKVVAKFDKFLTAGGELRGTPDSVVGVFPSDASAVSYTPVDATDWNGDADPGDVGDALDQLGDRTNTIEGALVAHLADASDSHDASSISLVDTGDFFTATEVEGALQELGSAAGHAEDHAARHAEAGADELNVADLGSTGATAGQVPVADGVGGVDWDDQTGGGAHPDLAAHDSLGLATDAELGILITALSDHLADVSDSHDASSISILDTANDFTATEVEGALAELQAADEADEAALAAHLSDTTSVHEASSLGVTGIKQTFMLLGWTPAVTGGCGPPETFETTGTNKKAFTACPFDSATAEKAQVYHPMPDNWDGGDVIFRVWWMGRTGYVVTSSDGGAWTLTGLAWSDGDAADIAQGSGVTVTDIATANEQLRKSADSAALTLGNSPAAGDLVYWELTRTVSDGADDWAADLWPIAVQIEYGITGSLSV